MEINKEYTESFNIAKQLISDRMLYENRMGINDDKVNTNLISKHYSPMIVRKYNIVKGWPLYIGLICDEDLSDLDHIVNGVIDACFDMIESNNIQQMRNITGILSETIQKYYNKKKNNCVEGIAILLYVDKCVVENFYGDYMNHGPCRIEWAGIINMLPHI